MDSADKFFRESHYNILRVLLSISGLWPFHGVTKRYAVYFVCLLVLGSGLVFQVLGIIEVWPNSFEVLDCIPVLLYSVIPMIKAVCLIYTLPKIKILLTKMKDHWMAPKLDEETKILHSYAIYGENFGHLYTYIYLGHSALFLSTTLLGKFLHTESSEEWDAPGKIQGAQKGVPYRVNYIVDLNTYYVPIFIHTATCEVYYLLLIVCQDVLYMTFVQHCCGLLAALRYLLENTFQFKDNIDDLTKTVTNNKNYVNDKCYAKITYSIRRHTEAIQFINILESIYRLPLFLHMSYVVSILSIVGYQIITNTKDASRFLQHAIYFTAAVINAFIQNWQGQKIIDYSEKVYEYAYNIQWYDMPNATKKLLILIMLRSIKPSQITAGKFVVMSYVSFNAVMRISSSYFMLLRSMQ